MRKITSLIMLLLMLVCVGMNAQTYTAKYGKGNGTFYKADGTATSSGFDAKRFVSNTPPAAATVECSYDTGLNSGDAAEGARLGANAGDNVYTIKVPNDYIITGYKFDCKAVNASHPEKTLTTEDNKAYNVSAATYQTVTVTGVNKQSTYFTLSTTGWSPINTKNFEIYIKYNRYHIVYNCYDKNDVLLESVTSTDDYADGSTIDVSSFTYDISGYVIESIEPSSVTINGADAVVKVVYDEASTFNYTVSFSSNIPIGTTIAINGSDVNNGDAVSYGSAVTESDVVVTYPSEYSYMATIVTITGTTITVDCYDPRWPVNFDKNQTFTHTDRHINSVSFDNTQTVDGLYTNINTLCYQDLTATKTVSLPVNTAVKPSFNVTGGWQQALFTLTSTMMVTLQTRVNW